jgi:hypothetical protein
MHAHTFPHQLTRILSIREIRGLIFFDLRSSAEFCGYPGFQSGNLPLNNCSNPTAGQRTPT